MFTCCLKQKVFEMGSASSRSSQVHSFQNEQEKEPGKDVRPKDGKQTNKVPSSSSTDRTALFRSNSVGSSHSNKKNLGADVSTFPVHDPECKLEEFETSKRLILLQNQLTETESQNLDLQERVQMLTERLEYLNSLHDIKEEGDNLDETIKAKDQYIVKMEKELKISKQELTQMKLRYKKRIKHLSKQLNEAKQEMSIQLFELKDEIIRLSEENQKLKELAIPARNSDTGNNSTSDGGKMQIVLELSNQLSEQSEKISQLEKQVSEKDETIQSLTSTSSTKQSNVSQREDYDRNTEERKNLRKLAANLEKYPKSKIGTFDYSSYGDSDEDARGVIGASRDSGLGSAGKNGRNQSKHRGLKNLVTFTDSDWDSEDLPELPSSSSSKIRSAPVETQASRLASRESMRSINKDSEDEKISVDDQSSVTSDMNPRKLKKKSSFTSKLRQENDPTMRTPVPSVAFADEFEFNDIPMYPSEVNQKYAKQKKGSFFLTQNGSPAGSDVTEPIPAV